MDKTRIAPYRQLDLKVYGYHLPQLPTHTGSVKVGETNQADVNTRIQQQTGTVGVKAQLLFTRNAVRNDGQLFHDRDLHAYYRLREIKRIHLNGQATEWYYFGDPTRAESMTDDYISLDYDAVQVSEKETDYILRAEQAQAVETTLAYFQNPIHGTEFLWNAKPRFGKTLSTYDLVRKLKAKNVLIVTNRPAIANSWFDDFEKFIAWQEPGMKFVSDSNALADRNPMSLEDYKHYVVAKATEHVDKRRVAFISLQDLKGARFAGGPHDKLEWVAKLNWDLLVIDEAHEGIDTLKTDRAFDNIKRRFTLHLSGTPFKAIANQKFHNDQIFNWSYLDEQAAKASWDESHEDTNPYESLPTLNLFTYQMSKVIEQKVGKGIQIDDETNLDYAFDLNVFFSTKEDGKFVYEADVIRFLDNLHTGKFPFAESEHQQELRHTFWLLPRVAAAKAMESLLNKHSFFKDYTTVLAAGDGTSLIDDENAGNIEETAENAVRNKRSYDRVKKAIAGNPRTITLSVGQLTTGVTIPEWSAVLMLSNIKSPAFYFQASFRAQNSWEFQDAETRQWFRKENAYVFDFAPDRTLVLFDKFANNLSDEGFNASGAVRRENIRELINFFPVIAEDDEGSLREISPEEVLTIPSHIKAVEVVKRGFMSNLLFANIGAIFAAPAELKAIIDKISPEANKRLVDKREIKVTKPMLNDQGEVEVPNEVIVNTSNGLFGDPIYKTDIEATLEKYAGITNRDTAAQKISKDLISKKTDGFVNTAQKFDLPKKAVENNIKAAEKILTEKVEENLYQRDERVRLATIAYEEEIEQQPNQTVREKREEFFEKEIAAIQEDLQSDIQKSVEEATQKVVARHLERQEEGKKKTTEDDVRDHLRGFARTIPAFLMAYGSADTTLSSYDQHIHPDTFEELTSITLDEFRKLRDGFDYVDENGAQQHLSGLFDESVFNTSIQEFFKLKKELGDYLQGGHEEDIFDYIPPQRTNQIFTPRRVVEMMVDTLAEQDPTIFTKRDVKFIDLYTKSGLYLTEIAKRLFEGLQAEIPDDEERLRWILENQVYGCAPSNIIFNIVRNYVYSDYPEVNQGNLLELDLTEAAKAGRVKESLAEKFGEDMKFDVIIGNPPYQGEGRQQIYTDFYIQSIQLANQVCLIFPTGWQEPKNANNLIKLNNEGVKRDRQIVLINNLHNAFPGVPGAEWTNVILWRRGFDNGLDGDQMIFTEGVDPEILTLPINKSEIEKPNYIFTLNELVANSHGFQKISSNISVRKPYGLSTDILKDSKKYGLPPLNDDRTSEEDIRVLTLKGIKYVPDNYPFPRTGKSFNSYKVFVPYAWGNWDKKVGLGGAYSDIIVAKPHDACTETYLECGTYDSEKEAMYLAKYLMTQFARALLYLNKFSQHSTSAFGAIPLQNFKEDWWDLSIKEINEKLFDKYDIPSEVRENVRNNIQAKNESNIITI